MNTTLDAYIDNIGLIGPGFDNWPSCRAVLRGEAAYEHRKPQLPLPALLPSAERRRSSPIVKLSLAVGQEAGAGRDLSAMPTVFSASSGDGENCHTICEMLASDDKLISPTRFHNSVHNAAAGYWSIAMKAMAPSSVLCGFDASFGAGLLEALAQTVSEDTEILLIACDTPYPEPLRTARPIPEEFGVGMLLSPRRGAQSLARIRIALTGEQAERMADPRLERLRSSIPAARSLPLMLALARNEARTVVIDYLEDVRLAVEVSPCS